MKEKEIDELGKKIENKIKRIKVLETDIHNETELINRKKNDKIKLEEECLDHEIRKRNRLKKLETIKNILNGNQYSFSDFKVDQEELKELIPETPLQGVTKIKESLMELKDVLIGNKSDLANKKEYNYVTIKYLADNVKFIIPEDPLYTFQDLIKETCDFFRLKNSETSSHYIFKDDYDTWPLNAYVNDYFLNHPNQELVLILQSNPYSKSKSKQETQTKFKKDDFLTKIVSRINDFLDNIDTGTIQQDDIKDNKKAKLNAMKAIRENEIILLIEKTFGQRICYLLFYVFFLVYILTFIISKNDVSAPIELIRVINNEFVKKKFVSDFTLFDFYTKDKENNYNNLNYTQYQFETSLQEITEIRLLQPFLENVYLYQLNFNTKLFDFIENHKIVGPIRFFQLKQKLDDKCQAVSFYTDTWSEVQEYFCYGSYQENTNNATFYNLRDIEEQIDKEEYYRCLNNTDDTSPVCILVNQGITSRLADMSYSYTGQYGSYNFEKGYYFDLTPNESFTPDQLRLFSKFFSYYWIDLSTRLVAITFNVYQATNDDNCLISITLYLEINSAQMFIKNFDVKIFKLFINFESLLSQIEQDGFKIEFLFSSISRYLKEYFYLLLLIIYSTWNLKSSLSRLFKEGFLSILYKDFVRWVIDISISGLILGVVIIRIVYMILQSQSVREFKKSGFISFFCVNYFTENWEFLVTLLEILMVMCITINTLNAFYVEFFARIFLTFQRATTLLFSFFFFYMIVTLAYASCFNIMFGHQVQSQ